MKTTFTLEIRVKYETNGAGINELRRLLERCAEHLANEGLMTGETPAEVETFNYKVIQNS